MTGLHGIPAAIVLVYIFVLVVVTAWAGRLPSARAGVIGYLLAGRQMPASVTAAMLTGLAVGGASTIGVAEQAYTSGISAGWYNAAWGAGACVMGLVFAARYRRLELTTIPELLGRYYTRTGRVLGVIGQLAIQIVVTSLQYVAGGAILSSLMPTVFTLRTGMMTTALLFIGVTLVGGFWAAGLTNVINVLMIYVGIGIAVVMTLAKVGGIEGLVARLPAGHPGFDPFGVGAGQILAWFLVMVTTVVSMQSVVQISFAGRDERASRTGFLWGAAIIFPVGFISALIGMAAAVLHPGIPPAEALPRTVLDLPPAVAGLALSGLWAADISTACALLLGSATLVSHDILGHTGGRAADARRERLICRLTVAAIGALTFVLALSVSGILKVLLAGLTLSTAYALIVIATMFTPGLCRRSSATWTLLATMVSLLVWLAVPSARLGLPHPIYATWLASLAAFGIVAAVDRRPIQFSGFTPAAVRSASIESTTRELSAAKRG
jgi:SSS family solute:Na+ symporter